jgi:hypothetical protein
MEHHLDEMDEVILRFFDSTKSKTELKPAKRLAGKLSQQTVAGTADGQTNGQQRLGTPCPLSAIAVNSGIMHLKQPTTF